MTHGELPGAALPPDDSPDPHIHLIHANIHTWLLLHPCKCEALCECDEQEEAREEAVSHDR